MPNLRLVAGELGHQILKTFEVDSGIWSKRAFQTAEIQERGKVLNSQASVHIVGL